MSEAMQLIICTFDATDKAAEVQAAIQAWDAQVDTLKLGNIAIVQKTTDGQIRFRETQDIRSELTEIVGGVVGGLASLIYAIAGAFGSVAGPMASYGAQDTVQRLVRDMGFPDAALQAIGARLDAGSSALITLVATHEQPLVVAQLERLGGHIMTHTVAPDIIAALTQAQEGAGG